MIQTEGRAVLAQQALEGAKIPSLKYVPGEGFKYAQLAIVGEAPGANEHEQGRPFIGRSGQLLRSTLEELGLDLSTVWITNVVKVRPEGNRTPTKEEIDSWRPALLEELDWASIVLCVGKVPQEALGTDPRARKAWHPAYILRNQSKKEEWVEQLREVTNEYSQVLGGGLPNHEHNESLSETSESQRSADQSTSGDSAEVGQ